MKYAPLEVSPTDDLPQLGELSSSSDEWALAQRVAASSGFRKSVLLTNFLLYVCDRKLRGHEEEITEQQIGVQALGRKAAYNPGDDNIVRNYARILRQRLDDYFADEGKDESLRISIPRGTYVPVFEPNAPPAQASPSVDGNANPIEPVRAPAKSGIQLWWLATGTVLLFLCGVAWLLGERRYHNSVGYLSHQFWTEVFDPQRSTYLVPADSGLAMVQDLTGQEIHLHEYVTDNLQEAFPDFDISQHRQAGVFGVDRFSNLTSTADLAISLALAGLPEYGKSHTTVRYARDIRMDELKSSNVVLLGGPHANPWIELFEPVSDFRIVFPPNASGRHLDDKFIVNRRPLPGEREQYANIWNAESHETYAILAFLPGLDRTGHALLLQGQNMGGTEAAADFALDVNAMGPILKKARLANGAIGSFQIVLQTRTVGADAPKAHVVAEHYGANDR